MSGKSFPISWKLAFNLEMSSIFCLDFNLRTNGAFSDFVDQFEDCEESCGESEEILIGNESLNASVESVRANFDLNKTMCILCIILFHTKNLFSSCELLNFLLVDSK